MDLILTIRESNNMLLKSEADDFEKWSKMRHTKLDFETFLGFNVALITFRTRKGELRSIVCTSNNILIKLFSLAKDDTIGKKKALHLKNATIHTHDKRSIDTWDLVENKQKTINLASWSIDSFITITPKNVEILYDILTNCLKTNKNA